MLKKVIGIVALTLLGATGVYSLTAEAVFDKVRARYEKYAGIQAEFTQMACDKVTGTCRRSGGVLILARPDKLRMEVKTPKKQLLVSDGTALFVYEQGGKQATKQALSGGGGQTPLGDLLFGTEKPFTVEFDLTDTSASPGGHAIKLVPKEGQTLFKTASLWVNPRTYACDKLEFVDPSEDHHAFELEKEKRLKKVDGKLFTFTPPAGVAVVEMK